jgi:hypothetical protein
MPTKEKPKAVCHPERDAWARNLCRSCFDSVRKTGKLPTTLRGPERIAAEEFAPLVGSSRPRLHPSTIEPIAIKPAQKAEPAFNTADPKVSEFVAGAVVKSLLDYRAAARMLKPDLSPVQQATLAYQLECDANVQAAVQSKMAKRGLDEASKQQYISILWSMIGDTRPESEKLRLQALRLLSKVFLPEGSPAGLEKPADLPIVDLDAGLEKMGLSKSVITSAQFRSDVDPETQADLDSEEEQ